jgi:hypothetical protein
VPFLRFSRDKRGYEHTYLVHTQNRRGKPSRPRVLYWYRTPPGIKVGRPPFDEEVRRRLEAQNPDVSFNWPSILATPFPPPAENEQWRERRKAERAAKQAHRVEEDADARDDSVAEIPVARAQSDIDTPSETATEPAEPRIDVRTVEAIGPRRRRRGRRRHQSGRPENTVVTPVATPAEAISAEPDDPSFASNAVDLPEFPDD